MTRSAHTVLLVAADPVQALDLLDSAHALGAHTMGPVSTLREVRDMLERTQPDTALVDRTGLHAFDTIVSFLSREGIPVTVTAHSILAPLPGAAEHAQPHANDAPPIQLGGYGENLAVVERPGKMQSPKTRDTVTPLIFNGDSRNDPSA